MTTTSNTHTRTTSTSSSSSSFSSSSSTCTSYSNSPRPTYRLFPRTPPTKSPRSRSHSTTKLSLASLSPSIIERAALPFLAHLFTQLSRTHLEPDRARVRGQIQRQQSVLVLSQLVRDWEGEELPDDREEGSSSDGKGGGQSDEDEDDNDDHY